MAVKENKLGDLTYLTIPGFDSRKVDHLFSTRLGWDQDNILDGVGQVFNIEKDKIYRLTQVHGDRVYVVDKEGPGPEDVKDIQADGLVTNLKGIALVTFHADCTPIYYYDRVKGVIGLAHSGWRGTLKNISKKIIKTMEETYGSSPEDIKVALGPSICKDCYEVKDDVSSLFSKEYKEDILSKNKGKTYLDLWKVNKINLLSQGIIEENISESKYCTGCNLDRLYSYRKEASKGRMVASIILK